MSHSYSRILNPVVTEKLVTSWLIEDQPSFDLQSLSWDGNPEVQAHLWCKSHGSVLAGHPFIDTLVAKVCCNISWLLNEGTTTDCGLSKVATISGKAVNVLRAERTLLNIISRCSGIATLSSRVRKTIRATNWKGILAGSRKTTPGFRMAEKYSLMVG